MSEFTHIHQTSERRLAAVEALERALKEPLARKVIIYTDNNTAQVKVTRVGLDFPSNVKKELRVNFKKLTKHERAIVEHRIDKGVFSAIRTYY
jgi:hypothetical protein